MTDRTLTVFFATTNAGKLSSVQRVFEAYGIKVVQHALDIPEVQEDDAMKIAAAKVMSASGHHERDACLLAIDSALHIPSLNGFPGPFVKQVTRWIGPEGYVRLLVGREGQDRRAVFVDAVACKSSDELPHVFRREVWGTISDRVWDGTGGTGKSAMDRVFIPDGSDKALIAMSPGELAAFRSSSNIERIYHDAACWFLGAK